MIAYIYMEMEIKEIFFEKFGEIINLVRVIFFLFHLRFYFINKY